jgi:adenylate cyclase
VADYSRLTGVDEQGTLVQLRVLRRELFLLKIAEYRARIIKTSGDGVLIEFASVVDAGTLRGRDAGSDGRAQRRRPCGSTD